MSELQKRIAVAVVAIPAILAAIYFGGWVLTLPVVAITLVGVHELHEMAARRGANGFRLLTMAGAAGLVIAGHLAPDLDSYAVSFTVIVVIVTAGAVASAIWNRGPDAAPSSAIGASLFGVLYLGGPLSVVPLLVNMPSVHGWTDSPAAGAPGLIVIALPLAATWVGDSCAYFAGSAWGKSKMAPTISPNKSWVGFWAGVGGAATAAVVWWWLVGGELTGLPVWAAVAVGALLGVGAVLGDLAESLLKREAGVKDSGTIFPGHGGALDRLDALLATLPAAYIALGVLDAVIQ